MSSDRVRMMGRVGLLLLVWVLPLAGVEPRDVLVLANRRSEDSMRVARHYMQMRKIPHENMILLNLPLKEEIAWEEYVQTLHNPMLQWLEQREWVEAVTSDQVDEEGRLRYVVMNHRVGYLVLCHGVPLKIANDPARLERERGLVVQKEFAVNCASVDSELALLPAGSVPGMGFVQNPLFQDPMPSGLKRAGVLRVSRLDGPNAELAMNLVDRAIEGESYGVCGRAYIDYGQRFALGDEWLRKTGALLEGLGYDVEEEETEALFSHATRFDAPAFYFGWWAFHPSGPIADPGFRFPPGAIAVHIHSFSASTVRSAEKHWVGPLVARGVTATVGNVYEPYLQLTHQPPLLMEALIGGAQWGEAGYYALPVLSWQGVLIGDPLYRPFRIEPASQIVLGMRRGNPVVAYAAIRQMNLLLRQHEPQEALRVAAEVHRRYPTLPLALAQARVFFEAGRGEEGAGVLRPFSTLRSLPLEYPVAADAALLLSRHGQGELALAFYQTLVSEAALPESFKARLLAEAPAAAREGCREDLAREWQARLGPVSR